MQGHLILNRSHRYRVNTPSGTFSGEKFVQTNRVFGNKSGGLTHEWISCWSLLKHMCRGRGTLGDPAVAGHLFRATDIQVFSTPFFKEDSSATDRSRTRIGTSFICKTRDRSSIPLDGLGLRSTAAGGQAISAPRQRSLRTEYITTRLQPLRILTRDNAAVEVLVGDTLLLQSGFTYLWLLR